MPCRHISCIVFLFRRTIPRPTNLKNNNPHNYPAWQSHQTRNITVIREVPVQYPGNQEFLENKSLFVNLTDSYVQCQHGQQLRSAILCITCPRYKKVIHTLGHTQVFCNWSSLTQVKKIMRIGKTITTLPISNGHYNLQRSGFCKDPIFVADDQTILGVVCTCSQPTKKIRTDTWFIPPTIGPETSIAEAIEIFISEQLGCIRIGDASKTVGLLTRDDLARAGFSSHLRNSYFRCKCRNVICCPQSLQHCPTCNTPTHKEVTNADFITI